MPLYTATGRLSVSRNLQCWIFSHTVNGEELQKAGSVTVEDIM